MAVAMRMSRGGSKKRPYYKIVIADVRAPRDGKFIERIGSYNPLLAKDDEKRVVLDAERAKHWLENGAQPSDRVARFLDAAGLLKREARNNPNKGKPGEKATERKRKLKKRLLLKKQPRKPQRLLQKKHRQKKRQLLKKHPLLKKLHQRKKLLLKKSPRVNPWTRLIRTNLSPLPSSLARTG